MDGKSASYALSAVSALDGATAFESPGASGEAPAFLQRLVGNGISNLMRVRAEVLSSLSVNGTVLATAPLADALFPDAIPSVRAGARSDRVLAEIDQDGFAFAVDPRDARFFERRSRRAPRALNQLDVVLLEGRVCIRKRYRPFRAGARDWGERPVPLGVRARRRFWNSLGFYLYSEAAVLLRLQDVPFVPKLRAIDLVDRAIYIDYVQGQTLRHWAARTGAAVYDQDLAASRDLTRLTPQELERREVTLLERSGGAGDFHHEILEMLRQMNARGVAPLDIKLGNFIRGSTTGRLYWIDFEFARVQSQPHWDAALRVQSDTVWNLLREDAGSGEAAEKVA
jgi:tRNA A-37 threonylcarbamoyl transferase component Bud32